MTDYGLGASVISRTTPALYGSMVIIGASAPWASASPSGACVLALNSADGSLIWSAPLDSNQNALSTGSPIVYNGIAYLGVSSNEENSSNPTFRGSLVAVSLTNGQILWRTYFAARGYSGAPVWSSTPVIDTVQNQIYVTTGNNYLVPPSVQACEQAADGNIKAIFHCQAKDNYEDSLLALNLATGEVNWALKCSPDDAWILACDEGGTGCPDPEGEDYDFGSGANLIMTTIDGVTTPIAGAGQKSGIYRAVSPGGTTLWSTTAGPGGRLGGIQWGTASDNQRIYLAISNSNYGWCTLSPSGTRWNGGSWAALDPATGAIIWQVPDPGFNPLQPDQHALTMAAVTVANGVFYAGSM